MTKNLVKMIKMIVYPFCFFSINSVKVSRFSKTDDITNVNKINDLINVLKYCSEPPKNSLLVYKKPRKRQYLNCKPV